MNESHGHPYPIAEWYAEAVGILSVVADDPRSLLASRARSCVEKKPILGQ
jgi:hypothetical protein